MTGTPATSAANYRYALPWYCEEVNIGFESRQARRGRKVGRDGVDAPPHHEYHDKKHSVKVLCTGGQKETRKTKTIKHSMVDAEHLDMMTSNGLRPLKNLVLTIHAM